MNRACTAIAVVVLLASGAAASPVLPAPAAQHADGLPKGVRCRIGSERFLPGSSTRDVYFTGPATLRTEDIGHWHDFDAEGRITASFNTDAARGTSRNGAYAVVAGEREMSLVDLATRHPLATMPRRDGFVAVANDASRVVTEGRKKDPATTCITILDRKLSGRDVCFATPEGSDVGTPALSEDGTRVAVFVSDGFAIAEKQHHSSGTLYLIDATSTRTIAKIAFALAAPFAIVALSTRADLVAVFENDRIHILDGATGAERKTWAVGSSGSRLQLAFAPDDKRLFAQFEGGSSRRDGAIIAWELGSGTQLWEHGGLFDFGRLAISADSKRVAYILGGQIRIAEAATGADVLPPGLYGLDSAALSEDGQLVATLSIGYVTLWDAHTCAVVKAIAHTSSWGGHLGLLEFIAGSHDMVVHEGDEYFARIRADGSVAPTRLEHIHHNDSHAISRDGKTIVFGVQDDQDRAQLAVWDLEKLRELRHIPWPKHEAIAALTFSPDQRTLIASTSGKTAEIELATGKITSTYTMAPGTTAFVFDHGKRFALDRSVIRRPSGKPEDTLDAEPLIVTSDGRLAVLGRDNGLLVWRLDEPAPAKNPIAMPLGRDMLSASLDGTILACAKASVCDVLDVP